MLEAIQVISCLVRYPELEYLDIMNTPLEPIHIEEEALPLIKTPSAEGKYKSDFMPFEANRRRVPDDDEDEDDTEIARYNDQEERENPFYKCTHRRFYGARAEILAPCISAETGLSDREAGQIGPRSAQSDPHDTKSITHEDESKRWLRERGAKKHRIIHRID